MGARIIGTAKENETGEGGSLDVQLCEDKGGCPVGLGKRDAQGKCKIYLNYSHANIKICRSCIILEV